jgi:hypothetical protein
VHKKNAQESSRFFTFLILCLVQGRQEANDAGGGESFHPRIFIPLAGRRRRWPLSKEEGRMKNAELLRARSADLFLHSAFILLP